MNRLMYLSLLLIIPFFLHADHGRDRLSGKWISPNFDTQIKIRVKRNQIRVKGLSRRGWTNFTPVRRNVFKDCSGNTIKIKNIHSLVYINRHKGERIRFVKKGHNHRNHSCNSNCDFGNDYFFDSGNDGSYYGNYYGNRNNNDYRDRNRDRGRQIDRNQNYSNNRIDGKYHVREIDDYVSISSTRNGLRAKKGNDKWVEYTQNRNRKNEYVDKRGNKYLVRNDGEITWKSRDGKVSLNLKK